VIMGVPWSHTKHFHDFLGGSLLFLAIAAAAALAANR
jgi:hypothetical protein